MQTKSKHALTFIFITVLIDVIGIGIIIPVLPGLISELTNSTLSEASKYAGLLGFAYASMQFLFSPILGALSDKFGRRPILLFSLLGLGVDYILMALAPSIAWLFIGRIFAGLCGASFTTATAYIADVSEPEKRAQNFGLIGAAFGLGFIIGPVIGGICSQWGDRIPFWVAAAFSLLNFVYGLLVLPESLSLNLRRQFDWKTIIPTRSLVKLAKYPAIIGLVICIFFLYLAGKSVETTWTFYTMLKFDWTKAWVGYSLGFVGIIVSIVQGGLIRIIVPKIGNKKAVYYGLLLNTIGLLGFAFASQSWVMFAFLLPYCLGGIGGPAMQGIISNQVSANEQGELQGALTGLMSLSAIIGPLLMNNLFAYFTDNQNKYYFPGAAFIAGALLIIVGSFFAASSLKKYTK